jgi:glycosyltransferase
MKICVIMASFNSEATIRYAVESFLAQTHADKKLLVVDGGSTDRTQAIVTSYGSENIHMISEKDRGMYDAMNKGLRSHGANAVGTLNSDDTFHFPGALEAIDEALSHADVVYGDIGMVNDHEAKKVVRNWRAGEFSYSKLKRGWVPPHPTFYVRSTVVDATGLFDSSYQTAADYDYMVRVLANQRWRVRYISRCLVDFKVGGISTRSVRVIVQANLNCLRSRRKNLGAGFVDVALFLKPAQKLLQIF